MVRSAESLGFGRGNPAGECIAVRCGRTLGHLPDAGRGLFVAMVAAVAGVFLETVSADGRHGPVDGGFSCDRLAGGAADVLAGPQCEAAIPDAAIPARGAA